MARDTEVEAVKPDARATITAGAAGILVVAIAAAEPLPNLSGEWITNQNERVLVKHGQQDVNVVFIADGACPNGGVRDYFIKGRLEGDQLRGKMMRCTRDPHLVRDCGLSSVYTVPVEARVSRDRIDGTWRSEYYAAGGEGACDYTRDQSGDSDVPFALFPVALETSALPETDATPPDPVGVPAGGKELPRPAFSGARADNTPPQAGAPEGGAPQSEDVTEENSEEDPGQTANITGGCWVGWLSGTESIENWTPGHASEHRFSVRFRLREELVSSDNGIRNIALVHEGSVLRDSFTSSGPYHTCSAEGEVTSFQRGDSGIWLNDSPVEVNLAGCRLPPGGGIYILGFHAPNGESMTGHCSEPRDFEYPNLNTGDPTLSKEACSAASFGGNRNRMTGRLRYRQAASDWSMQWELHRVEGNCGPAIPDTAENTAIQLRDLFDEDSAIIRDSAAKALDGPLAWLAGDPAAKIAITVVVKGSGSDLFDEVLGRARGDQLKRWFEEQGFDPDRVILEPPQVGGGDNVQVVFIE